MIKISLNLPYQIDGTITDSNSNNPSGVTIVIRNDRTVETISTTTNSSGQYLQDLGNLSSGYNIGDQITVIARFGLEDGEGSFTTISTEAAHTVDITTSEIIASTDAQYATITEVYNELDGKTTSDISAGRVRDALFRAEAEIDRRTGTSFKSNTITDEIYDINLENLYPGPNRTLNIGLARADAGITSGTRLKLKRRPIIAVSSLSKNSAGATSVDDWTELTEHTGTVAGDFTKYKRKGVIEWLQNTPALQRRSIKITYTWGIDRDSTDPEDVRTMELVRKLTIFITVRNILTTKGSSSQFDSVDNIALESISITKGIGGASTYLDNLKDQIDMLYKELGTLASGWGMGLIGADY